MARINTTDSTKNNVLKISLFAKKRTSKDGREFYVYSSRLTNKNGEEFYVTVKFNDNTAPAPNPKSCPMIIEINREDANLSTSVRRDEETDEEYITKTLWVKKYSISDEEYVDHSLDDII